MANVEHKEHHVPMFWKTVYFRVSVAAEITGKIKVQDKQDWEGKGNLYPREI